MPAFILHELVISAKIGGHQLTIVWAVWNQLCRNTHSQLCSFRNNQLVILADLKALRQQHLPDDLFVVIGLMCRRTVRIGTLQQTVVALRVEEALLVEAGSLEAVIHVGCDHEVVLILHEVQESVVDIIRDRHIAVNPDVP